MGIPYFAFGSNMLIERLRQRVPSARVLGTATLGGYSLRFNKLSKDGSGKANIIPSEEPRAVVHGVLYDLDEAERCRLDRAEGLGKGYEIRFVRVRRQGMEQQAFTYVAMQEAIREDLKPYPWYKELVIAGAAQNHLPEAYVRQIEAVEAAQNPVHG